MKSKNIDINTKYRGWLSKSSSDLRPQRAFLVEHIWNVLNSGWGFFIIPIVVIAIHLGVSLFLPSFALIDIEQIIKYLSMLLAVHTAINGILFIAVFFLIGSLQSQKLFEAAFSESRKRIGLIPISSLMVATLIGEGFSLFILVVLSGVWKFTGLANLAISNFLLFLISIGPAMYLLWHTFTFLDATYRWKYHLAVANKLTSQLARNDLQKIVSSEILSAYHRDAFGGIGMAPVSAIAINTPKRGFLVDIHLGRLYKLGNELKNASTANSSSLLSKCALNLDLNSQITEANCTLARLVSPFDTPKNRKLIKRIFKIKRKPRAQATTGYSVFHVLDEIHERTLDAIEKDNIAIIEETLALFKVVLDTVLELTRTYGKIRDVSFLRDRSLINPIENIRPYSAVFWRYNNLIYKAMKSPSSRVFDMLILWPMDLLRVAVSYGDFQLSETALDQYCYIYNQTHLTKNNKAKKLFIQLWREYSFGPEHFVFHEIRPVLNKTNLTSSDAIQWIGYLRQVYDALYTILSLSANNGDHNTFGHLFASFDTIRQDILWTIDRDVNENRLSADVKDNKVLLEEERRQGFLYLAGIVFLCAQVMNGVGHHIKWTIESGVEVFESDFSLFSNMATIAIRSAKDLAWPDWFSKYMALVDLPFINDDSRFYGDQLQDMISWVYVIIGSEVLSKAAVKSKDVAVPHIKELGNVFEAIEHNATVWSDIIDSHKLQELTNILEK